MSATVRGGDKLMKRLHAMSDGEKLLARLQTEVTAEAKRNTVPFRKTGNLGRTIRPGYLSATQAFVHARASYAAYVEKGTGIYGPNRRPIVPKRARVLAWRTGAVTLGGGSRVKGGVEQAGWAFAKSVRGRPATPFMEPAAKAVAQRNGLKELAIELWNGAA